MNENTDVRLDYPATGRNQEVILDVLKEALPKSGAVLEVASGSGQHITYFAQQIPQLKWQPSDIEAAARASIDAWRNEMGVTEAVHTPIDLDARVDIWSLGHIKDLNAIMSINMIHISAWEACAPSNEEFDLSLQSQNPSWGVRNLDDVAEEALKQNFQLMKTIRMPANNFSVIFHKKD